MPRADDASRYAYYVLAVLFCVNILNLADRQVVYILFPLIKKDLELTDAQLGALGALPFAIFYSFMGVPLGWLADRWMEKRKDARMRILVVRSVLVIPLLVAMFFVSSPFMLITLIVIGSSVSSLWFGPAAAVVHDLVRPELRSLAVAVYILCINVTAGISPLLVGKLTDMSGDPLFLQYMLLIAPVADIFAALFHYIGSRYVVADMQAGRHVMASA